MLIKRHGCPFLRLARVAGGKPFEPFGKDSIALKAEARDGADWPCHIKIANAVKLLRPSVQLPAGIHGSRGYTDFRRWGK
jgi:hypothetical protein